MASAFLNSSAIRKNTNSIKFCNTYLGEKRPEGYSKNAKTHN